MLRMAQGFLRHENSEKPVEQLGHQYSGELQSRSHFRQSSSNVSRFAMHDFINDLAQWAAREVCYRMEDAVEGDE